MNREERIEIDKILEKLRKLDEADLAIIKISADALTARQEMMKQHNSTRDINICS